MPFLGRGADLSTALSRSPFIAAAPPTAHSIGLFTLYIFTSIPRRDAVYRFRVKREKPLSPFPFIAQRPPTAHSIALVALYNIAKRSRPAPTSRLEVISFPARSCLDFAVSGPRRRPFDGAISVPVHRSGAADSSFDRAFHALHFYLYTASRSGLPFQSYAGKTSISVPFHRTETADSSFDSPCRALQYCKEVPSRSDQPFRSYFVSRPIVFGLCRFWAAAPTFRRRYLGPRSSQRRCRQLIRSGFSRSTFLPLFPAAMRFTVSELSGKNFYLRSLSSHRDRPTAHSIALVALYNIAKRSRPAPTSRLEVIPFPARSCLDFAVSGPRRRSFDGAISVPVHRSGATDSSFDRAFHALHFYLYTASRSGLPFQSYAGKTSISVPFHRTETSDSSFDSPCRALQYCKEVSSRSDQPFRSYFVSRPIVFGLCRFWAAAPTFRRRYLGPRSSQRRCRQLIRSGISRSTFLPLFPAAMRFTVSELSGKNLYLRSLSSHRDLRQLIR